ncbi:NHL-repeat-containing protein 4 [Rhinatrema bivittatum]|uniref:NHL-repeat-containing protein 4 n=1 Tax=Rhinatrema bivittatum TaxID=194408 RepID=UPI00112C27F1|nr:NHL-repeat-containing protein 4 [Rhinatrema bivittatum]
MDYSLETTRRKENLLRAVRNLQVKSESTLQKASPLLSSHQGMGMVKECHIQQLAEKTKVICHDLENIKNLLYFRQNNLVLQIPNPNGSRYGQISRIHCSLDGTAYVTSENGPWVHLLNRSGQAFQSLQCVDWGREKEHFLPEDVTVTRSGMVAVSDMLNGVIRIFNPHSKFSQGDWIKIGKFDSPRGIGVDSMGRILVADYTQGKVHIFAVDHAFKVQGVHVISDLCGPRYVSSVPDGGFVVSEECGDVKYFGGSHRLICSISNKYGYQFGNPAGVCTDPEGNIIVADEQQRQVVLFPVSGSPVCLVSEGLRRPTGVSCSSFGHLLVADAGENCVKVFKYKVKPYSNPESPRIASENSNLSPRERLR